MVSRRLSLLALFALTGASLALRCPQPEQVVVPGLSGPVHVSSDREGVPHLIASNDLDLARAQGYVHARDRFFQMDLTRREVSGDRAELLGATVIPSDVQNRTIGLRRAAARSLAVLSPAEMAVLQAYADGVNAWLAANPLPAEYAALELTSARPWDPVDSLALGKAISASLSLDVDVELTLLLEAYVAAGNAQGFDGEALLRDDVMRSAPIDPAATVPDATNGFPYLAKAAASPDSSLLARAAAGARRVKQKFAAVPLLALAMARRDSFVGSNEWAVAGSAAQDGKPIIANDPHLALDAPSTFYEWHLVVKNDPAEGPMNVSGVGFPGTPGVILGQNERITWGATTNPMDVTDTFSDTLHVFTPTCIAIGAFACIVSDGQAYPVSIEQPTYRANTPGDGTQDNLVPIPLPLDQSIIATVPFRSFGPIIDIENPGVISTGGVTTALVLQYTGFHATRELQTFRKWNRADNLAEFLDGLADFDVGSQNWAYADADGNLAYYSSAENPLRRDLEQGSVQGLPPFFIRDGSGPANWVPDPARTQGQSIPFAVLPQAELPQALNPENGFFVNANNDPAGTTLDNDPLNQFRPSAPGAIYYLNPGYADGLRAGRITQLVRDELAGGGRVSRKDMERFQANTQQLDAELLTPFLLEAFDHASAPGAPAELAALAADPRIAEAVGRLEHWDFSSPTGIPEGYDASDLSGRRRTYVTPAERQASIAATLYNVWRAKAIRSVIDARLSALGVPGVGSGDALKALHHLLVQEPYSGVGASGVDFIPQPAALSAEQRRDLALLSSLGSALDALAGPDFQNAFAGSTDQNDYRWGRLHRITFDNPLGGAASIPPAGGFQDLAPALPGLSRDGGYEVVNASGFSARAERENDFRFGGGPVRRYVGEAGGFGFDPHARVRGVNVIPGGPSGDPQSPGYVTQLGDWLTADYHSVTMLRTGPVLGVASREVFVPGP